MAMETWLRPNRRAIGFGFILPTTLLATGVTLIVRLPSSGGALQSGIAILLIGSSVLLISSLAYHLHQPRLACAEGELLVYLMGGNPIRVPVDVVECFFLGQTGLDHGPQGVDVHNVVVRLAERAEQWHHRDVKKNLGTWCGGYITVKGAWCEPITVDLMRELNRRLAEQHRATKDASQGKQT
jgi:hypothetical protein